MEGRKMGDLTIAEHVKRARSELRGLEEHIKSGADDAIPGTSTTMTGAYIGSIEMSLTMIDMRLREIAKAMGDIR
jgi:hypothetical protein